MLTTEAYTTARRRLALRLQRPGDIPRQVVEDYLAAASAEIDRLTQLNALASGTTTIEQICTLSGELPATAIRRIYGATMPEEARR